MRIGGSSLGPNPGGGTRPVIALPDGSVVSGRPGGFGLVHLGTFVSGGPNIVTDVVADSAGGFLAVGVNTTNQVVVTRYLLDTSTPSFGPDPTWARTARPPST